MAGVLQGFFCEAGSLGWRDREIDYKNNPIGEAPALGVSLTM